MQRTDSIHVEQQHQHEPAAPWLPATQALGELTSPGLNAVFRRPQRIGKPSGWWAHVPFAAWVVEACEPQLLVELGTHHGVSYAAFCEAVLRAGLPTRCYAVDHWRGDAHAGAYGDAVHDDLHAFNQQHYAAFSELVRSDFDAAVESFEDGSIDLLHIDGFHTYEAVRHDYETWRRKLSPRAVVLFHDTNVRREDFGVHRFFRELASTTAHFEFLHGHGLGLIACGPQSPTAIRQLCAASNGQGTLAIRDRFASLGAIWSGLAREMEAQHSFGLQVQALQDHHQGEAAEHARTLMLAERARDSALGRVQLLQLRIEETAQSPRQDERHEALEQPMALTARRMADMSNELARLQSQASQQGVERHALLERLAHAQTQHGVERHALLEQLTRHQAQHGIERSALLEQLTQAQAQHADAARWLQAAAQEREALLAHQSGLQAHAQRFSAQVGQLVPDLLRRHGEMVQVMSPASRSVLQLAIRRAARTLLRQVPRPLRKPFRFLAPALRRRAERRHPVAMVVRLSLLFDARWYLSRNADVAASGMDAAHHYAIAGGAEGRDPSPWFSTRGYLQRHPDVARSGLNALYHYERHGRMEGRAVVWSMDAVAAPQPAITRVPVNDQEREHYRAQSAQALRAFLDDTDARITLRNPTAQPLVSIVLVLHNHAELTFRCLQSLALHQDADFELIVVDNASCDLTGELLARVQGARVLRQAQNLHFLLGANTGAREARGSHLLFLNNDTQVEAGALAAASGVLESEPDVGAVGARVVLLDGRLQEAGGIVWRDGSCSGFGRGESPDDPAYLYRRDVDYCSGAFLMVRRSVFETLAGFDPLFAPAYYEDTDLCMRMRSAGWRVVYEPSARIVHFETGSAPSAESAVELMRSNQQLFAQRHAAVLQTAHRPAGEGTLLARTRPPSGPRVLFIDDQLPLPSLGAGNPRACHLLHELHAAGCFVTHYPLATAHADLAAAARVLPAGLEAMVGQARPALDELLVERTGYYDMVLVSRPHNMQRLLECCNRQAPQFLASTRLVYDAEAIFALRESLRRNVLGLSDDGATTAAQDEFALARRAATVLAVSDAEAQHLRQAGCADVRVLDHAMTPHPTAASFDQRQDILFVGRLEEDDSPNADSVRWFVQEVMPELDRRIGTGWRLQVVGGCSATLRAALESPRIRFHGRVDDLAAPHDAARLFVAPTRFAAGVPHKVHGAAALGLPAVVTRLIGNQLNWPHGEALLIADSATGFATACAQLYQDRGLWERLRAGALAQVARSCDPQAFRQTVRGLLSGSGAEQRSDADTHATEAARAATARAWGTPPEEREREQGQFWMEQPLVAARLNRLSTGNAELQCLPHLLETLRAQGWRFPVRRIASLGCGFGGLERQLAALGVAERIDAYDIAESALVEARRLAADAGLAHLHYHLSDLETQPLPEGEFDIVFACHSVHHIEGLDALFANVRHALRPGGIFHLQEYVGPDRFQWTDAQLRGVNEFQDTLPQRLRMLPGGIERGHVARPSVQEVIAVDPSEAVCSAQIIDALGRHLRISERRDLGGALLHMGLSGIAQNFDMANGEDIAHLQRLFDKEDQWMAQGRIGSDFAVLIATRD
ncbi:MAG: class I SAM-dependent methyltransferase [Proteobacteria bacterium]|nr:class I SAM-dependent methyltransferase [Pseudomonadota bacterium]